MQLPIKPVAPVVAYANVMQAGAMLYVSGQGPIDNDGNVMRGKVGAAVSAEEAQQHARSAVGMGSLPGNITVEIESIFMVEQA